MTQKQKILEYIIAYPGVTDSELSRQFHASHQTVNRTCRILCNENLVVRLANSDKQNRLGNYPINAISDLCRSESHINDTIQKAPLQEEEIKHFLTNFLQKDGWHVKTAWGHRKGVDIEAERGTKKWLIEVKGPGSRSAMRTNYFLSILGETLRRMDDPNARYSIAFPDMKKYRTLWATLPRLAKERTTIDLLLIDTDGSIDVLK